MAARVKPARVLYSTSEVAEMFGTTQTYIYRLIKRGELRVNRSGSSSRIWITAAEVESFLKRTRAPLPRKSPPPPKGFES
jgi:excisionase family DNA binding protein